MESAVVVAMVTRRKRDRLRRQRNRERRSSPAQCRARVRGKAIQVRPVTIEMMQRWAAMSFARDAAEDAEDYALSREARR